MNRPSAALAPLLAAAFLLTSARADEGMWTFDNVPTKAIADAYDFSPSPEWLERVKLASVRVGGCSASFVSPDGLIVTNHHCVEGCVERIATRRRDYARTGFLAGSGEDETRCPNMEANRLVEIRDVTAEVQDATKDLEGEAFVKARRAIENRLEASCGTTPDVRCDLVSLYGGGLFHLYRYRRWDDVRLVFAPEMAVGAFGGDPDNFNFPRYALDAALVRVYENGSPVRVDHWLPVSSEGIADGDLVFVSGNPGSTSRLDTVAEIRDERDRSLPSSLIRASELRGRLASFMMRGRDERRMAEGTLYGIENGIKANRGRHRALVDPVAFARREAEENELRARVKGDAALDAAYGGAWDAIEAAVREYATVAPVYGAMTAGGGLLATARTLVEAADELRKPEIERRRSYSASGLPRLEKVLATKVPLHRELDTETLTFAFEKLREELGADDPFVRRVLGERSPREVATEAVRGTKLDDPSVRLALFRGGAEAIAASNDPMIRLARVIQPEVAALRDRIENTIDATIKKKKELIAKARFAVYGTSLYPDATFTLRLSYGKVAGWRERGKDVPPFTTFGQMFERHTGRDPYALPTRWLDAKGRIDLSTPLDFVTTNDIIGGNSGSPAIDRQGRFVGVVFDGNIHSLGGDYWYDGATNRTVVVDARAILEALDKVYGAEALAREIRAGAER